MNAINAHSFLLLSMFIIATSATAKPPAASATITPLDDTTLSIAITLPATPDNAIYRDYLAICIDTPDCIVSPWKTQQQPVALYDKRLKKDKYLFTQNVIITTQVTVPASSTVTPSLQVTYLSTQHRRPHHVLFPLRSAHDTQPSPQPADKQAPTIPVADIKTLETPPVIEAMKDTGAQLHREFAQWLSIPHNGILLACFLLFVAFLLLSSTLACRFRIVRNGASLIIIGAVLVGAYWYKPPCFRAVKKAPFLHLDSYTQALSLARLRQTNLLIIPTAPLLESLYEESTILHDLLHTYVISIPGPDWQSPLSPDQLYLVDPDKETILKTWPSNVTAQNLETDLPLAD